MVGSVQIILGLLVRMKTLTISREALEEETGGNMHMLRQKQSEMA